MQFKIKTVEFDGRLISVGDTVFFQSRMDGILAGVIEGFALVLFVGMVTVSVGNILYAIEFGNLIFDDNESMIL